ncbi:unnamed protein product [Periconia digitata]|uniref:Protein kinase domain-containing protein n=1 Tax=Periconia digitata TaxID=1303443 RepID=A0A9W4XRJ6_9PLEO|nr:unnamed protein product [Periconia digitata]
MDPLLNNKADVIKYMNRNMVRNKFEGHLQRFLPASKLEVVTSLEVIRNLVVEDQELILNNQEKANLPDRISHFGRKLFAICVFQEIPLLFLKAMLDNGLTDRSLPLSEEQFDSLISNRKMVKDFTDDQKHFNTMFFKENCNESMDEETSDQLSMPIDYNGSKNLIGRGAFGAVYDVRIHPDHHNFTSNGRDNRFAMKIMEKTMDEREKNYHAAMIGISHSHLAKCLSSFTLGENYYMFYELASGDLEKFICTHPVASSEPGLTPSWLAQQLAGLAAALRVVHNPRDTTSRTSNTLGVPQSGKDKTGYIHDIKPDNILVFQYPGNLNWLRLSDFSCAKVNELNETVSGNRRSHKTDNRAGTPSYRAPEQRKGSTSRPYDLWSIGCVYLEILVWFTEHYEGLERFRDERTGKIHPQAITDDGFFYDTPSGDCLRPAVTSKISELSRKCTNELKAIADAIPLLLKIKPEERLNASQLAQRFKHLDTGSSSSTQVPFIAESLPVHSRPSPKLPVYDGESDDYVKITKPSK